VSIDYEVFISFTMAILLELANSKFHKINLSQNFQLDKIMTPFVAIFCRAFVAIMSILEIVTTPTQL